MASLHQIAYQLIKQYNQPLYIHEIVQLAMESGLVVSTAASPVASLTASLKKSMNKYEHTAQQLLMRMPSGGTGELIGLYEWKKPHIIKTRKALLNEMLLADHLLDTIIMHYNLSGKTDINEFMNDILTRGIQSYLQDLHEFKDTNDL